MKISSTQVYRGPNSYAHFRVIRHRLDLGPLEQWPTARIGEAFIAALLEKLPGLRTHGCSYREEGGLVRRMREDEGTWLGHVLEHVTLELQTVAGSDVSFGKTRSIDGSPGHYNVVFEYRDEEVGLDASRLALDLLHHLLPHELKPSDAPKADWDFAKARDRFIRTAQRSALGPSTASLVKAAEDRDIPWLRLNRYSLIQFGHGRYQKRIQATTTCETSNIAVDIASDKEQTHAILHRGGRAKR
jgi:cyanophycin synthetase